MARTPGAASLVEFGVRLGGGRSYPVIVGRGAINRLPALLSSLPRARCALLSDANIEPLHGTAVAALLRDAGREATLLSFPAGEPSKTRATKERLEDAMIAAGSVPRKEVSDRTARGWWKAPIRFLPAG